MVARINTGKSISKALNYNEQKVKQGKAEMIATSGFLKDASRLSYYDKVKLFEKYQSLNNNVGTNTLHASLNFDPSEKLTNENLVEIADAYMDKIGFVQQPYLVYRHYDSAHPHIHIVSTNIQKDGNRLSMHNMGRNQSEKARKEIELQFGLVRAGAKKAMESLMLMPVNAQKVSYGKSETKRAISNVLAAVIHQYKFTSLPELNAVLKLYNVSAERGSEGSSMYRHKGLHYRVLDESGKKVGAPVKASAFYMKPMLTNLEKKFSENETLRVPYKKGLQTTIGWILNKQPASLEEFIEALQKERISTVVRKGKEGAIYGITYVDHKSKCVFNGSDLGKSYSAKVVLESFSQRPVLKVKEENMSQTSQGQLKKNQIKTSHVDPIKASQHTSEHQTKLPHNIIPIAPAADYIPNQLKKKRKKKRKWLSI